eukprot:SAG11_NODE_9579_length_899_cov_0.960000_1_plen_100_part_00
MTASVCGRLNHLGLRPLNVKMYAVNCLAIAPASGGRDAAVGAAAAEFAHHTFPPIVLHGAVDFRTEQRLNLSEHIPPTNALAVMVPRPRPGHPVAHLES